MAVGQDRGLGVSTARGQTTHIREEGGSGEMLTARFESTDTSQDLPSDGSCQIVWVLDWDNIGFPADYADPGGVFYILAGMDGEYEITAFARFTDPTDGQLGLDIQVGDADADEHVHHEQQSAPFNADTPPKCDVSGGHLINEGGSFYIRAHGYGNSVAAHLDVATLYIKKIRSIPPL